MISSSRRSFLSFLTCSTSFVIFDSLFSFSAWAKGESIDWETIASYADTIIPKTERSPSASEAHIIQFLKNLVTGNLPRNKLFRSEANPKNIYLQLQELLNHNSMQAFKKIFKILSEEERVRIIDELAAKIQGHEGYRIAGIEVKTKYTDGELFRLSRAHVIGGYFAEPKYGGNFDYKSWESIGHTCHFNYPKPKIGCPPHVM